MCFGFVLVGVAAIIGQWWPIGLGVLLVVAAFVMSITDTRYQILAKSEWREDFFKVKEFWVVSEPSDTLDSYIRRISEEYNKCYVTLKFDNYRVVVVPLDNITICHLQAGGQLYGRCRKTKGGPWEFEILDPPVS